MFALCIADCWSETSKSVMGRSTEIIYSFCFGGERGFLCMACLSVTDEVWLRTFTYRVVILRSEYFMKSSSYFQVQNPIFKY